MTSKTKILSGHELVAKGFTKVETTLPEVGLKDVEPNGSWLEQKQIQSALEARKHLIEVERIEKSGALSIATWNEEKMLAEVTQKVGGHWQFVGHNVGNRLFIYPEEALYLMEVNSLQLFYNDVKVSLQQAYTLLLQGKVTLLHYKVYSSLSRLGYRLFRHEKEILTDYEKKIKLPSNCDDNMKTLNSGEEKSNEINESVSTDTIEELPYNTVADLVTVNDVEMIDISSAELEKHKGADIYQRYVERLKNNRIKPCNNEVVQKCFDEFPSMLNAETATLNVPETKYVPDNIDIARANFNLNLENIKKKVVNPDSSESNIYSPNDEVNGSHIRRIRHLTTSQMHQTMHSFPPLNIPIRFFNYWRPSPLNFNFIFQRSFMPRQFGPQYMPRLSTNFRILFNHTQDYFGNTFMNNFNMRPFNPNISRPKRRRSNAQDDHLEEIKKLAARLKRFYASGNTNPQNIDALQRLINTYNVRYKTRIRLNSNFEVDNEQNIVETITLDDDEPQRKRHRSYDVNENFEQSLNLLKALAQEFQNIERKGNSTPKHRRAFTKALRSFNDTYNVEYYASNEFEIIDSRHITVASSDSDSHIDEPKPKRSSKKLKNPFNIMKRLSETQNEIPPTAHTSNNVIERDKEYSQRITNLFPNSWLPNKDDFGRAEIVEKGNANHCLIDNKHDEFLYDFLTLRQNKFNNWLDLKISFFKSIGKAVSEFQTIKESQDVSLKEDGANIKNVIDKLKVIKTANAVNISTSLTVHFDVYNRNVQNFKKSKPPPPHFRLICMNEQAGVPNGEEIAALNTEYDDNITIVFAIVGVGSISYLRMNPTDLPMYIPSNNKI